MDDTEKLDSFEGFRFTEVPRFPYFDELWDGDRCLMRDGRWVWED